MGSLLLIVLVSACGPEPPAPVDFDALSAEQQRLPENALAAMTTAEGVEVQLFAAEPLLTNPTNMAIDARGRIWICEANNYRLPYNPKFEERPAGDRILILEDTDGDGRADESKVFYQGPEINAALGIAVLGERVFVSHSPYVFVFTDEDGDDRPERQDTLFTGIDGPDDDHGMHAFVFGPDGRYYFNFGNGGHQLMDRRGAPAVDQLGRPINNRGEPYRQGMAFRWDPDSSFVEVLGHNFRNNYELTVDPFGTVWQSDNDDDGNRGTRINFVMEYGNYGYTDEVTAGAPEAAETNYFDGRSINDHPVHRNADSAAYRPPDGEAVAVIGGAIDLVVHTVVTNKHGGVAGFAPFNHEYGVQTKSIVVVFEQPLRAGGGGIGSIEDVVVAICSIHENQCRLARIRRFESYISEVVDGQIQQTDAVKIHAAVGSAINTANSSASAHWWFVEHADIGSAGFGKVRSHVYMAEVHAGRAAKCSVESIAAVVAGQDNAGFGVDAHDDVAVNLDASDGFICEEHRFGSGVTGGGGVVGAHHLEDVAVGWGKPERNGYTGIQHRRLACVVSSKGNINIG